MRCFLAMRALAISSTQPSARGSRSVAWNGTAPRSRSVRRRCSSDSATDHRSSIRAGLWASEILAVQIDNLGSHMTHSIQLTTGFVVIAVPDEMPQPPDSPLDDFQSCAMLRFGGIDAAQRLLNVLNPHRDMPPVQNAGDGSSTAARTRPGSADSPSLRTVTVRPGRHPCSRSALRNVAKGPTRPWAPVQSVGAAAPTSILPTVTSMRRIDSHERRECELRRSPS